METSRMRVTMLLGLIQYYCWNGSLAHAGKVRSQTPKMDKWEKKTGRARWQMWYNRCFVSVVLTFAKWRAAMPTPMSFVILAFSNKPLSCIKTKIKTRLPAPLPPYPWPVSAFSLSSVAPALSSILLCPLIHSLLKNLVKVSSLSPLGYSSDLYPDFWDQGSFISLFVPEI